MPPLIGILTNIIGPIFIIVGLAALIDRRFKPDARALSGIAVYLLTPCLVLDNIATTSLQTDEVWQIVAMASLNSLVMICIGVGVGRALRFERALATGFALSVGLLNTGNYGLPVSDFAFGKEGLQRAVIFFIVSSVWTNTVGIYVASRGTGTTRQALLNVFKAPLLYAMALGFILNLTGLGLPVPLQRAVGLLSQATVPFMLIVMGLQLSRTSVRGRAGPLALAVFTRLVIGPLVAVGLAALLGTSGLTRQVTLLQAAMPSGVMSGVLATLFGGDAEFVAATILLSTLASMVTLSVLLSFLM
jgi:malate permease and related proteins